MRSFIRNSALVLSGVLIGISMPVNAFTFEDLQVLQIFEMDIRKLKSVTNDLAEQIVENARISNRANTAINAVLNRHEEEIKQLRYELRESIADQYLKTALLEKDTQKIKTRLKMQ